MQMPRGKALRFKLSRFFHDGGLWYVEMREGCQGPFPHLEQAMHFLARFKRRVAARNFCG